MPTSDEFSKVELAQEALWRKCAADPVFFFEHYWKIQHPEHGAILFELFDAQRRALPIFMDQRYVLTLKSRQIGWTTLVAAFAFWETFFYPDRYIVFLSRGEREAKKILAKSTYGYARLPEWMRARGPRRTRENLQEMPFDNGSGIESLPSGQNPSRGDTAYRTIVDEWAFLEFQEEAWAAIEGAVDVGGRVIGLSTANGWGNFFHEEWVRAETGVGMFTPIFEPWSARDDRDDAWYATKKRNLPEWQLFQEYPRTPEEAFIKSGNPFFDTDKLHQIDTVIGQEGYILNRSERRFIESAGGPLEVWELPQRGERYAIGADVAEGLEHGDFSSAHVKAITTGKIVAHWHGHVPPEDFGDELVELGLFYNRAFIGVEANNHGLTTLMRIKGLKYPNIYYHRIFDERTKRETNKIGWTTNKKTRPMMLDDLGLAIRELDIEDPWIVDRETIGELRTFIRDKQLKLRGQPFDDRTMSLAITIQMADYVHVHQLTSNDVEWGQGAWWLQQVADGAPERKPLGYHNTRH